MKTEYFYRTSRGATAMKFLDEPTARNWYAKQHEKHGKALPVMELVKHTIVIEETICEPFDSPVCIGGTPQQVSIDATTEGRVHQLQGI